MGGIAPIFHSLRFHNRPRSVIERRLSEAKKLHSTKITPFSRGENSKANPGFGLGLTIVDTIAAQHEGAVTFEQGAQGLEVRFTIQR